MTEGMWLPEEPFEQNIPALDQQGCYWVGLGYKSSSPVRAMGRPADAEPQRRHEVPVFGISIARCRKLQLATFENIFICDYVLFR